MECIGCDPCLPFSWLMHDRWVCMHVLCDLVRRGHQPHFDSRC